MAFLATTSSILFKRAMFSKPRNWEIWFQEVFSRYVFIFPTISVWIFPMAESISARTPSVKSLLVKNNFQKFQSFITIMHILSLHVLRPKHFIGDEQRTSVACCVKRTELVSSKLRPTDWSLQRMRFSVASARSSFQQKALRSVHGMNFTSSIYYHETRMFRTVASNFWLVMYRFSSYLMKIWEQYLFSWVLPPFPVLFQEHILVVGHMLFTVTFTLHSFFVKVSALKWFPFLPYLGLGACLPGDVLVVWLVFSSQAWIVATSFSQGLRQVLRIRCKILKRTLIYSLLFPFLNSWTALAGYFSNSIWPSRTTPST